MMRAATVSRKPLSIEQVAMLLGVKREKVRNLYHSGELDGYRVGRRIIVYADSVEAFKERNANTPAQKPGETARISPKKGRPAGKSPITLRYLELDC